MLTPTTIPSTAGTPNLPFKIGRFLDLPLRSGSLFFSRHVSAATPSGSCCFLRCSRPRPRRASPRHPFRMPRQSFLRCRPPALALERTFRRARAFRRRLCAAGGLALCKIALGVTFCSFFAALWRRQLYSRPPRLRETNGNRLLRRTRAMFAFSDVFHFLAHKLARLSAGRFAFALSFNCFFFWHNKMVSPLATRLDVDDCVGRSATAVSPSELSLHTAKVDMRSEQYSSCERIGLLPK